MATTNVEKKLVRSKSGLRIIASKENDRSIFELSEPPWIPDNECAQCMNCHVKFDFMKRRHHCRRCGRIFCSGCCDKKVSLPRMCFVDPVRLCFSCAEVSQKEKEFYDKHLKTLINGSMFLVNSNQGSSENENGTFLCRLSSDHRRIVFESNTAGCYQDVIEFSKVHSLKVQRPEFKDSTTASGLHISYDDGSSDTASVISLTVDPSNSNSLQATAWVSSLVKAFKMMRESRDPSTP